MMLQIENDMKNASAKLAAEQAERMVQDSIKASMERIDSENENMRTWEENMVRRSGYHVDGKSIHREAVVDSSLGHTYYEGQSVHYYEDFYDAGPKISVSFSKEMLNGLTSSAIMLLVEQANLDIENWTTDIFGKVEKDDEGNPSLKQNYIARDSGNNSKIDAYKKLAKKDYDSLNESEQNEFNDLSELIVTVRDGKLGEWIGYAPQFKNGKDNVGNEDKNNKDLGMDLSKGRDWNIKHPGSGQMGKIMLDFQWNNMIEQQGWQKVALPAYDQPLWRGDGGWFEPPTIRGVASIVFEIVGQASSQAWFSYADDLIFAAIDVGGGFKSAEQVGLDLAKTAATAVISMGCSAAGSALSSSVSAAMDGAGKAMEGASKFANFATQAGISVATTYVSTVATSAVNNVQLGADGKLTFDKDNFGKSLYSASTIAGAVGAGFTAGLTTAANMKMQKMGDNGAAVNKFYGTAVNAGISAAGKLSEYAVYSAYALAEGRTLADAYDDMGGLTFNIGSLGMFADMMATGIARNNATGQAGKFGEIAQKLEGKGILEINIGSNGITGKFGMGGFDLAGSLYTFGKRMYDKKELESYLAANENKDNEDQEKKAAATAWTTYVYGDSTQENTVMRLVKDLDQLEFVSKEGKPDNWKAQTTSNGNGGRRIQMLDSGNDNINAIQLGHEAYRDGKTLTETEQKAETIAAVLGHAGMAGRMMGYAGNNITGDYALEGLLFNSGRTDILAAMADMNYDSSADYWKFTKDGNIVWDGENNLYDEDGKILHVFSGNGGHTAALAEGLGITEAEARQMLVDAKYTWDSKKKTFVDNNGNDVKNVTSKGAITNNSVKDRYDFQHNYIDKVFEKYNGSMQNALQVYVAKQLTPYKGCWDTPVSTEQLAGSMMISSKYFEFAQKYDEAMIKYGNVGSNNITQEIYDNIYNQTGWQSNDNILFDYIENGTVRPVVGASYITTYAFYGPGLESYGINEGDMHSTSVNGTAADLGTNQQNLPVVSVFNSSFLINNSYGYTSGGGNFISLYTNNLKNDYKHLLSRSNAYSTMHTLNSYGHNVGIWSFPVPSNYQIGNVGNSGTLSSGVHLHFQNTRRR